MGRETYKILVRGLPRTDRQDWVTCAYGIAVAIVAMATYSVL
jgi:hypothetical protein